MIIISHPQGSSQVETEYEVSSRFAQFWCGSLLHCWLEVVETLRLYTDTTTDTTNAIGRSTHTNTNTHKNRALSLHISVVTLLRGFEHTKGRIITAYMLPLLRGRRPSVQQYSRSLCFSVYISFSIYLSRSV